MKGKHLHLDCASGAAGDMTLGALLDLGVPIEVVGDALDAIGAGRGRLRVTKVVKHGIAATDLKVDTQGALDGAGRHAHAQPEAAPAHATGHHHAHAASPAHSHAHAHAHHAHDHAHSDAPHHDDAGRGDHVHDHVHAHEGDHAHGHAHYHYADLRARILAAPLTAGTRARALDIFDRIAKAEATIHGKTVEDVVFHEVGAIDSVVDIVGTAAALDWLSPTSVSCTGVAMGHGTIRCAHGVLPVPAPAALEIMKAARGVMTDGGVARELCTPTGAAILAATVTAWGPAPAATALAVGWGAGDAELADRANVLRAVVMEPVSAQSQAVWQVEANLDDMTPELCAFAAEAVMAAGALDVWWTPITMKKGRPALTLSALADSGKRDAVIEAILRETTTIGVRYIAYERKVVPRTFVSVETRYGPIVVKVSGDNAAPEYEACAAAARRYAVPVKQVYAAAVAAYDSIVAGR